MKNLTIVSIDPSLRFTAMYCCIYNKEKGLTYKDDTLIETEKSKIKSIRAVSDTIRRCSVIKQQTEDFVLKHSPDVIFVETPTGSQSANGMKSYGIVCMMIATLNPPPIELTPTEVKKSTTGNKNATKADMIEWSFNKEPKANWILSKAKNSMNIKNEDKYLTNKNEHLADAIAIAHTGLSSNEFSKLLKIIQ